MPLSFYITPKKCSMLCHIVISPVLGGITTTGTGAGVTGECQWFSPPVVLPLEGSTVPGKAAHSSASSVKVFVFSSWPSTTRTALSGTTSSLGVQGVSAQYSSAVSVAMNQVRKS